MGVEGNPIVEGLIRRGISTSVAEIFSRKVEAAGGLAEHSPAFQAKVATELFEALVVTMVSFLSDDSLRALLERTSERDLAGSLGQVRFQADVLDLLRDTFGASKEAIRELRQSTQQLVEDRQAIEELRGRIQLLIGYCARGGLAGTAPTTFPLGFVAASEEAQLQIAGNVMRAWDNLVAFLKQRIAWQVEWTQQLGEPLGYDAALDWFRNLECILAQQAGVDKGVLLRLREALSVEVAPGVLAMLRINVNWRCAV